MFGVNASFNPVSSTSSTVLYSPVVVVIIKFLPCSLFFPTAFFQYPQKTEIYIFWKNYKSELSELNGYGFIS